MNNQNFTDPDPYKSWEEEVAQQNDVPAGTGLPQTVETVANCPTGIVARDPLFAELDSFTSEIFSELALIDDAFSFLGDFFRHQAELIQNGREPDYLSEDETKTVELYKKLEWATKGLGKILQAGKMEFELRTKIYPRLKKIAKDKLDFCLKQIPRCEKLMNDDYRDLLNVGNRLIGRMQYRNEQESTDIEWSTTLKRYRNSRFHWLYLKYFVAQLQDWDNDIFSASYPIPDMEDVNTDILFQLYRDYGNQEGKESFTTKIQERLAEIMMGKVDFCNIRDIMLIRDKELLATLQTHCSFPFSLTTVFLAAEGHDNIFTEYYANNEAYRENSMLCNETQVLDKQRNSRTLYIMLNGLLLTASASIPIFASLSVGWSITLTVICLLLIMYRCSSIAKRVNDTYDTKIERINLYAETLAHQQAGEGPRYKTLNEVIERKNRIWIGAIIGFIIGLFVAVVGCIPGAIIGALLGAGYTEEEEVSDGSDWQQIKTGTGLLSKILTWIILAFIAFEIVYFFSPEKEKSTPDLTAPVEQVEAVLIEEPSYPSTAETEKAPSVSSEESVSISGLPFPGSPTLTYPDRRFGSDTAWEEEIIAMGGRENLESARRMINANGHIDSNSLDLSLVMLPGGQLIGRYHNENGVNLDVNGYVDNTGTLHIHLGHGNQQSSWTLTPDYADVNDGIFHYSGEWGKKKFPSEMTFKLL